MLESLHSFSGSGACGISEPVQNTSHRKSSFVSKHKSVISVGKKGNAGEMLLRTSPGIVSALERSNARCACVELLGSHAELLMLQ